MVHRHKGGGGGREEEEEKDREEERVFRRFRRPVRHRWPDDRQNEQFFHVVSRRTRQKVVSLCAYSPAHR